MRKCPYTDCDFEYTKERELDDHLAYMLSMGDTDHDSDSKLRF